MAASSLSALCMASDIMLDYCCSACNEENSVKQADVYCEDCHKFYCIHCIKLHSQLFKKHIKYGRDEMGKWPVSTVTEEFLEKCERHRGEKLKLFCEDHRQLCCNTCVLLNHRPCSKVTMIADTTLSATDLQSQSVKITIIMDQLIKLQTKWESNMKSLQTSYEEQFKELTNVRQKINAALDELEKTTLKEMDEAKAALNVSLKSDVDTCSKLCTELARLNDAIQEASKKNQELTFIAHQKSEEMIKQAEKYLHRNSVQTELSLKFIVDTDTERCLSNFSSLGYTLHVTQRATMTSIKDQAITVAGTTAVSVKIPSDTSTSYIIMGICSLFNGQILLADHLNNRLKLLNLQYKVIRYCDLSGSPCDMCLITPCQVAVAVESGIQFVSVNSGNLVKERRLQLSHECTGVSHHQGDLYVTSGTALYKYTLTGTLVNIMYEDTSSFSTVWGCAVSPSGDKIYVTNHVHCKLLTLARDGTVISTFTDPELKGPSGIHVTPVGQLLICCLLSNSVIQVDTEGKKKIATVATQDGIINPRTVFYSWKSGSVIVGNSNENITVLNTT